MKKAKIGRLRENARSLASNKRQKVPFFPPFCKATRQSTARSAFTGMELFSLMSYEDCQNAEPFVKTL
jgi:hypothetical protein